MNTVEETLYRSMYIQKTKMVNKINGKFTVGVSTLTYWCYMKQTNDSTSPTYKSAFINTTSNFQASNVYRRSRQRNACVYKLYMTDCGVRQ
jgi:hypothetical protein